MCVQLLYIWIRSHFQGTYTKTLKHYMDIFVSLDEFAKKKWLMHQLREQWSAALQNLDSDSVTWKDPQFTRKFSFYGYGDKLWVPLIGLWCVINYTLLLVLRQYRFKQFIPATYGLNHVEFDYVVQVMSTNLLNCLECGKNLDGWILENTSMMLPRVILHEDQTELKIWFYLDQ